MGNFVMVPLNLIYLIVYNILSLNILSIYIVIISSSFSQKILSEQSQQMDPCNVVCGKLVY